MDPGVFKTWGTPAWAKFKDQIFSSPFDIAKSAVWSIAPSDIV
jgi:hypothetical protein